MEREKRLPIVGGLLGHWAVWTQKAAQTASVIAMQHSVRRSFPRRSVEVTDSNAAFLEHHESFCRLHLGAYIKSYGGRDCWKESGVWIKTILVAIKKEEIDRECIETIPISTMTIFLSFF